MPPGIALKNEESESEEQGDKWTPHKRARGPDTFTYAFSYCRRPRRNLPEPRSPQPPDDFGSGGKKSYQLALPWQVPVNVHKVSQEVKLPHSGPVH
jgi:hypothetical protein